MMLALALLTLGIIAPLSKAFQSSIRLDRLRQYDLRAFPDSFDTERMKSILKEESMNLGNYAASAKQMQSMTPGAMDQMIIELDQMNAAQIEQLKAMGMDPDLMKQSMKIMRDNPDMMISVGKMMESMTPEELLEKSRVAQEQIAKMTPDQIQLAAKAASTLAKDQIALDAEIISDKTQESTMTTVGGSSDPNVIDSMFRVAELMSYPPTGGVTFYAFSTLPPITLLSGPRDEDLSKKELAECWADGSLGATRVDRQGFERVWREVQEYFEDDIMEDARKSSIKSRAIATNKISEGIPPPTNAPVVGSTLSKEQMDMMATQVKGMSDEDMTSMLDQMSKMTPEQKARMKAMGVDPAMMEKTAGMLKSNPLMRKAANAMMKNMSPEQLMKVSQQSQQQMANMSREDYERAMDKMNNSGL
jgi:hypothetical protein